MAKKLLIISSSVFILVSLLSGCVKRETQQSGEASAIQETEYIIDTLELPTEYEENTSKYKAYTCEWYLERHPYDDESHPDLLISFGLTDWIQENKDEFEEYLHDASEYWDEDGNFVYPSKDAFETGWIRHDIINDTDAADAIIPQEVMDKLDTAKLLEIANNEKIITTQPMMNNAAFDLGYMWGLGASAAYSEFLSRDDYPQVLYDYYISIEPEEYIGNDFEPPAPYNSITNIRVGAIMFNETTLVTDDVFDALSDEQKRNILAKKDEISKYIQDNADISYSSLMCWAVNSESGFSTFDAMINNGISPKWRAFVKGQ